MLIVFGGLPGTGKTSIARKVVRALGATYVRVDAIEQAFRAATGLKGDVGAAGYAVACAVAESNLALGRTVVADSVNPIDLTRQGWRQTAGRTGSPLLEVEIVCSDAAEHRRRVENRRSDIAGFQLPDWPGVMARHYEPWPGRALEIDTARTSPTDAAALIVAEVEARAEG